MLGSIVVMLTRDDLRAELERYPTKDLLYDQFPTKDYLHEHFPTKDYLHEHFPTKDYLHEHFPTKAYLHEYFATKADLLAQREELQRDTTVLIEDLRSEMRLLFEGVFARFDALIPIVERHDGQLAALEARITALEHVANSATISEQEAAVATPCLNVNTGVVAPRGSLDGSSNAPASPDED
jgi:hypothetical protein